MPDRMRKNVDDDGAALAPENAPIETFQPSLSRRGLSFRVRARAPRRWPSVALFGIRNSRWDVHMSEVWSGEGSVVDNKFRLASS